MTKLAQTPAPISSLKPSKPVLVYIQRKGGGFLETVDQFATRKEAKAMLVEYQLADSSAHYYLSTRACKAWKI